MVVGLITDNDESAYREEVHTLTNWCHNNNLSLNISKTKELVVDFRRRTSEHPPITIDGTSVKQVSSFKFLGITITKNLTWTTHTQSVVRKAHQCLFFLRRLKKFGLSSKILRQFYSCTVQSILTGCINAWCGNCTALNRKALQRIVQTAQHIVGGELPGHLHPTMCEESTEDHQRLLPPEPGTLLGATIRQTVPQHQNPNQQNARQLLLTGHQTAEL
jgi:hypothetical protein